MRRNGVALFVLIFILGGCLPSTLEQLEIPENFTERVEIPTFDVTFDSKEITIGMIGDILLHDPLYTYENYDFAFESVKDKLLGIDFLVANQESMPGGMELGLSGFPRFNSPKHIIRDLKVNGIDMVSIANNHTIDRGESGLLRAIGYIQEYGMLYVGAYTSFEDQADDRIVDVGGIRLGILAYTYGTNGMPVPLGKEYLVSLIDRERMEKEIARLSGVVDVLIVSMHWGKEYHLTPSREQEDLAGFLSSAGADIIFGHHPHVLQRFEEVGKTNVFYSIGNFYSAQQFDSTNIGGIARVTATKVSVAGKSFIKIEDPSFFSTAVILDTQRRFKVIPLKDAGSNAIYGEEWVLDHLGVSTW